MEPRITQIGMLVHVADLHCASARESVLLPPDLTVDAEVDVSTADGASFVRIRLNVSFAGVDREPARRRIDVPHRGLAHSNTTLGDADVAPSSIGWSRGKEPQ